MWLCVRHVLLLTAFSAFTYTKKGRLARKLLHEAPQGATLQAYGLEKNRTGSGWAAFFCKKSNWVCTGGKAQRFVQCGAFFFCKGGF